MSIRLKVLPISSFGVKNQAGCEADGTCAFFPSCRQQESVIKKTCNKRYVMIKLTSSKQYLQIGIFLAAAAITVQAGTFFSDFNTGGLPAGSHTNANTAGGAYLELTGGVGDSGCLKLTKSINSQNGSFILDDLDSGSPIYGFDVTFKVRIGGGTATPADGMSLCVAPDLSDTILFGEGGAGSGLRFCW